MGTRRRRPTSTTSSSAIVAGVGGPNQEEVGAIHDYSSNGHEQRFSVSGGVQSRNTDRRLESPFNGRGLGFIVRKRHIQPTWICFAAVAIAVVTLPSSQCMGLAEKTLNVSRKAIREKTTLPSIVEEEPQDAAELAAGALMARAGGREEMLQKARVVTEKQPPVAVEMMEIAAPSVRQSATEQASTIIPVTMASTTPAPATPGLTEGPATQGNAVTQLTQQMQQNQQQQVDQQSQVQQNQQITQQQVDQQSQVQPMTNQPNTPVITETPASSARQRANVEENMTHQIPEVPSSPVPVEVTTPQPSYEAEKSALEYAKQRNLAMVMSLVPKITRFDVDDGTSEGTLLHYAAYNGWLALMELLIKEKGVHPSLENRYDARTPLLSACRGGKLDAVKYCIKNLKKKYWSATNENGLTCSHFSAREGHPEILSYIIELSKLADIPPSMQSLKTDLKLQWTPLHYAAANGHTECAVVLLLEAGGNPYKRGYKKQSPIDLARARGDKKMIEIMHDPIKYKITSMLDTTLGMERKAREKAVAALREEILRLKQALQSIGPKSEPMEHLPQEMVVAESEQVEDQQQQEVAAETAKKRSAYSSSGQKSIPLHILANEKLRRMTLQGEG